MELFYILLILLVVTRGCGELAERIGQPALVGELVSGMILGVITAHYSGTFPVLFELPENEVFHALTDLGIFFLMLLAGIEMRPREFADSSFPAFCIALGGFLLPLIFGLGLGYLLVPDSNLRATQILFIAVALSITAVPIAVRVLIDLKRLESPAGQTIVSAAVFDDIISLLLLAVLAAMMKTSSIPSITTVAVLGGKISLFFLITVPLGLFALPALGNLLKRFQIDQLELSFLLIVGFGFALLAEALALHFIIGAFVAGLFFERKTFDKQIYATVKEQVSGMTTGFLAPIFFASIGYHLNLSVVTEAPLLLTLLIVTAFAGKLLGAALPAKLCGFSSRGAMFIGAGMTARGAVELIIADIALRHGVFTQPVGDPIISNLFSAVVLMTLITTVGAPILMNYLVTTPKQEPCFVERAET